MPQPFLNTPFRGFPSQRSRTPLEAASCPAVIHQSAEAPHPSPYYRRFPQLPRPRRSRPIPPSAMGSLSSRLSAAFPFTPGLVRLRAPFDQLHRLRSVPPSANPFTRAASFLEREVVPLLVFCPSEALTPASRPLEPAGLPRHPHGFPLGRPQGACTPRDRVGSHRPKSAQPPRQLPDLFRTGLRHPSVADLLS
jgi:hypothetical protein